MKKLLLTLLLFSAGTGISAAKTYDLKSPDGKIAVRVDVGADAVTYSISRDGKELIAPSPLSLTLADGRVLGRKASVRKASAKSVDEIIEAPFYKRSAVEDRYNSLTLTFKGDYGIDFRAYDDGAAYRFRTSMKDEITVTDELVDIRFPEDFTTLVPYARDGKKEPGLARYYFNSFENTYSTQPVSKVADDRLAFLPILADRFESFALMLRFAAPDRRVDILADMAHVYYDLAGFSEPKQLAMLLRNVDETHLLYGSDTPYTDISACVGQAEALEETPKLTERQKALLFTENALTLLPDLKERML